jgi:hypothetical protein
VIVAGGSISYLVTGANSIYSNPSVYTNFLNTLESGIIIAGLGLIVLGVGIFLDSLQ